MVAHDPNPGSLSRESEALATASLRYYDTYHDTAMYDICALNDTGTILVQQLEKASSYIAQYPVLRTDQSTLHFTSLTDLFTQTPSRLLWEAFSHML